ncbi:MAG: helix-turn-helix transcriptional regulator [Myxococcales bacterium]
MESYKDILSRLGQRARRLRMLREMRQAELAERAGVAKGTVMRFEQTGRASVENVLRIAKVLGVADGLEKLFEPPKFRTFDEAMQAPPRERQRVRPRRRR